MSLNSFNINEMLSHKTNSRLFDIKNRSRDITGLGSIAENMSQ